MSGSERSAFSDRAVWMVAAGVSAIGLAACAGAPRASGGTQAPTPEPVPVAAPAITAPAPAEVSAQVRSTRSACASEAAKQQYDVVDFVTFNRLDENNWDTTIRARQRGRLVRIGCRHDLRAGWTYVYTPAASDGGNPWGPGGPPKAGTGPSGPAAMSPGAGASVPVTAASGAAAGSLTGTGTAKPPAGAPARTTAAAPPRSTPTATTPKPAPGSQINLGSIADTTARNAIAKTREACLAEAGRRKVPVDDFEAFRRVDGSVWEAMLVVRKARTQRSCRLDLASGKATIK